MKPNIRSRKGFTLAELCVVIALISIVVTMALGFITRYRADSYEVVDSRSIVSEITTVRNVVNSWMKVIDNQNYEVSAMGNSLYADNLSGGSDEMLTFADGTLTWISGGVVEKSYTFHALESAEFQLDAVADGNGEWHDNLIRCRVFFGETQQDLFFNQYSKTQRDRFAPADR